MFLVVPPKDKIALFNGLLKAFEICNHDTFMGFFLKIKISHNNTIQHFYGSSKLKSFFYSFVNHDFK